MSLGQASSGRTELPGRVPHSLTELTPDWLTAALRRAGVISHAAVVSVTAMPVGDYGMSGNLRRLLIGYDRHEPGAPPSVVAKAATDDAEVRAAINAMGSYEREVRFYTELAPRVPMRVPRCYFSWVNPATGESLLLLEDLSSLPSWGWRPQLTVSEAEAVLRQLAALHAAWWASEALRQFSWLELRGSFTPERVASDFPGYWEGFLPKLSVPVTEEILDIGRCGRRYLRPVWAYLISTEPLTLVHNDVQGANLLFDPLERSAVFLDWQEATYGRGAVDVAYFLCGCLATAVRRIQWDRLIRMYHDRLLHGGVVGYSFEQCQQDCRLALLPAGCRVAAAVGYMPDLKADPGGWWNDIVPRFADAIGELDVPALCRARFG